MRRTWRIAVTLLLTLALSAPSPAAKKKKPVTSVLLIPGVTTEITSPPVALAAQKCENWAWAAGVEAILRSQDVALDQHFWVQKSDGGEVCLESLAPLEHIAKVVNGEYVLDDTRKVRLEAHYVLGAPVGMENIVLGLRRGQPALMVWKGHAYILYGAQYDEYMSPAGYRYFDIREIQLIDPFYEDERRRVAFVRGQDENADIGGLMEIVVTPIQPTDWLHRD